VVKNWLYMDFVLYLDDDCVFCIEFFVNLFDLVEDDVVQDDLCFC